MLLLELPHVNVLSKIDLLRDNRARIEECDPIRDAVPHCALTDARP